MTTGEPEAPRGTMYGRAVKTLHHVEGKQRPERPEQHVWHDEEQRFVENDNILFI